MRIYFASLFSFPKVFDSEVLSDTKLENDQSKQNEKEPGLRNETSYSPIMRRFIDHTLKRDKDLQKYGSVIGSLY